MNFDSKLGNSVVLKPNFKSDLSSTQGAVTQSNKYNTGLSKDYFQNVKNLQTQHERERKLSLGLQLTTALCFVGLAGVSIYQFFKGRQIPKTHFRTITEEMPALTDACWNPVLRKSIKNTKEFLSSPKELLEYTGATSPVRMKVYYGPTGTGKSYGCLKEAQELDALYAEIQFSDISSPYIGEASVNISKKFAEFATLAQKNPDKRYFVVFNEIDSLLNNVEKLGANNKHLQENRTAYLNGLDLCKDIPNLFIRGTTNINPKSGNLDSASLGRFGEIVELGFPTAPELASSLKFHLRNCKAAKDFLKNDAEINEIANVLVEKYGVHRDVEKIVENVLSDFTAKLRGKPLEEVKEVPLTKADIMDVINVKKVWAAAIDAQPAATEMNNIYQNQAILEMLMTIFQNGAKQNV